MSAFQWAMTGALCAIAVFIWWFIRYWLPTQPVDKTVDRAQADRDLRQIVQASRPADLERTRVRGNTAYGERA